MTPRRFCKDAQILKQHVMQALEHFFHRIISRPKRVSGISFGSGAFPLQDATGMFWAWKNSMTEMFQCVHDVLFGSLRQTCASAWTL